ncbi:bacillithiol biosynthesis deacetylase BshB2 [Paenibacillus sp. y28]|uniref:bacillithiol biosynthesis deacetylase BshB2 n=1 Tax=Paenibacillus sp. y28 TaxID=3129110 RepID=UPI00301A6974
MEHQRHILVVLPHPDDEVGMAGTLAWHIQNGTPVTYVCLTLGEMGRNLGNPPFASRSTLPAIRRQELEASCKAIGIQDVRYWGMHDKTVEFEPREPFIARIQALLAEISPSLVLTYYPGYSVHPDHDACGAAVIEAVRRLPAGERPAVHCTAFASNREAALGKPDISNDVGAMLEFKQASLRAHRSQFQIMLLGQADGSPELIARLSKEAFWTYPFS